MLRPLVILLLNGHNGQQQWSSNSHMYKCSKVWNQLRDKRQKVTWRNLIWGSGVIPKHSFICWLPLLNKLPTMDRLCSWGFNVSSLCRLVVLKMRAGITFFFSCFYSK